MDFSSSESECLFVPQVPSLGKVYSFSTTLAIQLSFKYEGIGPLEIPLVPHLKYQYQDEISSFVEFRHLQQSSVESVAAVAQPVL
jgi:hypothetical protein